MSGRSAMFVAIFAAMLIVALGCAVDQAKEVALYRDVIDLETPTREPGAPLSLRDALLLANRNNETLAIEGEDYLRTLIQRRRAAAGFLPTVDLVGAYVRRDETGSNGSDGGDDDSFDLSADLTWEVFSGFRDVNQYWRDTYIIAQERNDLLFVQESLLLDVARVYYQVLRSEETLQVLRNSLTVQEERVRETRGRLEAGVARPLDVAQTEAQLAATRTTLVGAGRDITVGRDLLALLVGVPVGDVPLADLYDVPESLPPLERYLATAAQQRRDLAAAAAAIAAARRNVDVAFGQYYPTVSLNLSGFLYRETAPDERAWDGLLLASVPVFAAGRIHADVREAWSFYREALLVHAYLERQVAQQVQEAYQNMVASSARLEQFRLAVNAAQAAFDQAEASYQAGLATNVERVVAQDTLLEAQLGLTSELYDRKVLYLTLLRAAGLMRSEVTSLPPAPPAAPLDPPPAPQADG